MTSMWNSYTEKEKKEALDNEHLHSNLENIEKQEEDLTLVYQLEPQNLSPRSDGKND